MFPQIHVSCIPGIEPNFEQKGVPYTMYVGICYILI